MELQLDRKTANNAIQDALFAGKGQYRKLLLRASEVGVALGWSRAKAYREMKNGTLPVVRTGASIRVPAAALETWIQQQTTGGK